jgi:dGTPase
MVLPTSRQSPLQYSAHDCGRQHDEPHKSDEERNEFEIDRARIIHSAAFRRLQGKTQVFVTGSGDFFRTRLTHSLEVAQIGKGLALRLGANPDLIEACSLAHDLGHPPFGHKGEKVLGALMKTHGGFEANAQNIRLLTCLTVKFRDKDGLNLTRATLDGILKYKQPFSAGVKKFYYDEDTDTIEWATANSTPGARSFECQIMDWADEIAYSVHDLEDGMKAGMISSGRLRNNKRLIGKTDPSLINWAIEQMRFVEDQPGERARKAARKELTSRLIHEFLTAAERVTSGDLPAGKILSDRYRYRVAINPVQQERCTLLKNLMFHLIVDDERVATMEKKSERMITGLFEVFTDPDPRTVYLYPEDFREAFEDADAKGKLRLACDYIAGMTDEYAEDTYARLFLPKTGTLFSM